MQVLNIYLDLAPPPDQVLHYIPDVEFGIALPQGEGINKKEDKQGQGAVDNKEGFPGVFDDEREYHRRIHARIADRFQIW